MKLPMGPTAGLWIVAALSLVAVVVGMSRDASPVVGIAGAVCFTLAAGFLAVAEAVSARR